MNAIRVFSSDYATATANFVVFVGLILAALRMARFWLRQALSKFSSVARKSEQHELAKELTVMRQYRAAPLTAIEAGIRVILGSIFGSLIATCALIAAAAMTNRMTFNHDYGTEERAIDLMVMNDPAYIFEGRIAFSLGLAVLYSLIWRTALEILRPVRAASSASRYSAHREKLLNRYRALRALR